MGLINQLFGNATQQPQENGLIQNILSQRFQPDMQDVGNAAAQSFVSRSNVTPAHIVAERLKPIVDIGNMIGNLQRTGESPSAVREYQYYSGLNPQQQQDYLKVKRAEQLLNLGGSYGVRNPVNGNIDNKYEKTLPPEDLPEIRQAQSKASAFGKEQGERSATLKEAEGSLPQLETTVKKLSDLGKKATYTFGGQLRDIGVRQLGLGATEGAKAREEYVNTVRDVLFPQLRQTFGAQFTAKEGESLIGTLGDPDKSPEEKDAALKAFIDQKRQTIGSMRRELGISGGQQPTLSGKRVSIITPDGQPGTIDADHINDLLAAGGKLSQ